MVSDHILILCAADLFFFLMRAEILQSGRFNSIFFLVIVGDRVRGTVMRKSPWSVFKMTCGCEIN